MLKDMTIGEAGRADRRRRTIARWAAFAACAVAIAAVAALAVAALASLSQEEAEHNARQVAECRALGGFARTNINGTLQTCTFPGRAR